MCAAGRGFQIVDHPHSFGALGSSSWRTGLGTWASRSAPTAAIAAVLLCARSILPTDHRRTVALQGDDQNLLARVRRQC